MSHPRHRPEGPTSTGESGALFRLALTQHLLAEIEAEGRRQKIRQEVREKIEREGDEPNFQSALITPTSGESITR